MESMGPGPIARCALPIRVRMLSTLLLGDGHGTEVVGEDHVVVLDLKIGCRKPAYIQRGVWEMVALVFVFCSN